MIYNAVDTNIIQPVNNPLNAYLAYIGRLNFDKGVDIAVNISRITGIPLKIAGVVRPHEPGAYLLFEQAVKPFLGKSIEFIGPIDDAQKTEFLGNALALLMPNRWREPFGIVMAEALAAGTPIIGSSLGSIPEVVEDGATGYVCNSLEQMCEAVFKVHAIDRQICREAALSRFSQTVYMQSILDMFSKCQALVD
jgi:glycosyltransferase involved in cell wall biosynthesis